jgi:lipopolysaccharide export system permease protein
MLIFDWFSGLFAMVSALFTVAWIQRHNEMTALMAAGVHRIRVLIPIIVAVGAVSLLSAANRELLIPHYRADLSRRPQDPLGDKPQLVSPRQDNSSDVILNGRSSYASEKRIEEPDFLIRSPVLQQYGNQLTAANAYYKPAMDGRPGGYLLDGVREPKHLDTRPSLLLDGQPILITPHDAPDWLKPNQCFLRSDLNFDFLMFEGVKSFKQLSSTSQLITALRNPSLDYGADVRVAIHSRIVKPLLDMTLLFLGLPLVIARESRNVFMAMGLCMAVTLVFTLVIIGMQQFGEASYLISPALSAWAPLMIFVPLAAWMAESLGK